MTVTFTDSNWDELWQQAPLSYSQPLSLDSFETLKAVPPYLGRGYTRSMELYPGVWLDLADQTFHQDWLLKIPAHDHLVQCLVHLSGFKAYADVYPTLGDRHSYLSGSGISPAYTIQYQRSQRLVYVNLHLLPEAFAEFLAQTPGVTDAIVKLLLKQEDWKVSFFPKMTPIMQQVAQQILDTPFRGSTRLLHLQSKVFKLLTLQLQPLLCDQRLCQPLSGHKPETIARIYHAKEVLDSQLESPPALLELARYVGISDRTLQRGFRDVFGTTVVGYLIQQRLEWAEQLLRQRQWTVAEVATRVGYGNMGHFAVAFKRRFGISPSQCLAGKKVAPIS